MGFIKIRMDITSNFCSQSHGIDPYNQQSTHTLFFQTLLAKMIEWTQWNPNEISTYLGVTSKMNGRQEDQLIEFLQRVSELDRQLCINNISPQYGHQYQQWSITPTLSYSLTASSLSDEQIERIHKIIHQNIVAYKGFIRHWPCRLKYGHHQYCSLEITDLNVEQWLRKIHVLYKIILYKKHRILIQAMIECSYVSAGIETPLLEKSSINVNYANIKWMKDVIIFMGRCKITILTKEFFNIIRQRRNDKWIM